MPSATRTITIERPVADVFAFFTNPANDAKWRNNVQEMDQQGAPTVGQIVHQVVEGPGGRKIPADIRITAFDVNSRYAFEVVAGPVRPVGEMTFAAKGDDATVMTFSLRADLAGIKKIFMGGMVQKSMDATMDNLDKARHLLDAGV